MQELVRPIQILALVKLRNYMKERKSLRVARIGRPAKLSLEKIENMGLCVEAALREGNGTLGSSLMQLEGYLTTLLDELRDIESTVNITEALQNEHKEMGAKLR